MRELEANFKNHCSKLGVNSTLRTSPSHDGSPHVEKIGNLYHWVVTERGSEFQRKTTALRSELEYWLVSDVVSDLSIKYELKNRVEGQDFRRIMFDKRIELMNSISLEWGNRIQKEIELILKDHPFNDGN